MPLFSGTHLQVRHVDGFLRMMAQTTRTRARMCFWGIFHIAFHLGGQKPQFWGVNRRFQAKLAKSKNVHIIKTTASIPTKFCTVITTTKCPSWAVPTHALQIQDGGRPPSWKNRKIAISRLKFERRRRNLARWRSSTLLNVLTVKIWNFEKARWRRPPSWKVENWHISATV